MGFNSTATTITVTARLTTTGRSRLLTEPSSILSHFVVGDSDSNYQTNQSLLTGEIPATSGDISLNNSVNINIADGISIRNKIYYNNLNTIKPVEGGSSSVRLETSSLGEQIASGTTLLLNKIVRSGTTNSDVNYLKSLGLPITTAQLQPYSKTLENQGFSDTAFSSFSADTVLMGVIDNSKYGELIDGKSIKMTLPVYTGFTTGGTGTAFTTYDIYSSFLNITTLTKQQQDQKYKDSSINSNGIGDNITYLVSDNIQKPNNDSTLSWSTGYDQFKSFENAGKALINFQNGGSVVKDKIVGIFHLDKGIFAFTDSDIVTNIVTTGTTNVTTPSGFYYYNNNSYNVTIDSVVNNLVQNITCKLDREEFNSSSNNTWGSSDPIRISEIGITDATGELLAIGKLDRHVTKSLNDFIIFDVRLLV
jgi:hypothetical protein